MERLYYYTQQRESVVVGANNREIERGGCYTSPSTPKRSSDVDFNDVFGGPPRRSSMNEMRHSLSPLQLQDLRSGGGDEAAGPCSPAWPGGGGEKPVFGEDSGIRRRYPNKSNDFFDDIFGGEESPRVRGDRDPLSSRVLSPALPLPEPVASSLPSAFSLPPKLTKGGDLPTFGSSTRSKNPLNNIKEGIATPTSNGLGSSDFPLSRFSTKHKEESKNDLKPPYRQSLLSKEFSDISDKGSNMKQDKPISEVSPGSRNGQFHFSIYKWASKGVPLVMPLRAERKEKFRLERCSSAKEWKVSEITTQNDSPIAYNASFLSNRQQDGPTTYTTIQTGADSHQIVEQMASAKAQSDTLSCLQTVIIDVSGNPISSNARAESNTDSVSETRFLGKTGSASENQKLESKSLRSLLNKIDEKQDYDEMTERERREESKMKSSKKSSAIFYINMGPKKSEEKKVPLEGVKHSKATSQGLLGLAENMGKDQAKGKVKEFVRIFNQEAVTKPRVDSKSKGSTYKQRDALRKKKEVEGNLEQPKKENSAMESSNKSANNLSQQDEISVSAVPDTSFAVIGDTDQSFHGNFTIQVLAEDENDVLQNQDNQEIQVIDNKIQQWSRGKEGNIRSLLSTLQYVLWPGCGWKPVPLVDIIEGNAVKRAYQRALLCLHPDKLQQKGAASDQKYVAEKVFDILQEAWTQFSMIGAL